MIFLKNNKQKFYSKIFLFLFFFLIFGGFFYYFLIFNDEKINFKKTHIIINFPEANNDKGYNQKTIEGVCLGELGDIFQENECEEYDRKNIEIQKKISFSYANTSSNPEKFKKHIEYYIKIYKIEKFILPGFSTNHFFKINLKYFSKNYPKVKFVGIDTYISEEPWFFNFWQVNTLHYYSGYHAGLFASAWALKNEDKLKDSDNDKSNGKQIHFSSVGGMSIPAILNYSVGFKLGIWIFNEKYQNLRDDATEKEKENILNIEFKHVGYQEIGSFDSTDISVINSTKAITKNLFQKGSSIVFMIAISLIRQGIEAAIEADRESLTNNKHFIIGVDNDVKKQLNKNHRSKIITSAIIDLKEILKNIIKEELNKKNEKGKNLIFGGHKYATIPESKTEKEEENIWNDYFSDDKEYFDISELNKLNNLNLIKEFIGEELIANITGKENLLELIDKKNGLIYDFCKSKKIKHEVNEYKKILESEESEDFLTYIKNF